VATPGWRGGCGPLIAGRAEERARAVARGTDPILSTSFRIDETNAAALAAVGPVVSGGWALRTGQLSSTASSDLGEASYPAIVSTTRNRALPLIICS
jgi:hypothetical protein